MKPLFFFTLSLLAILASNKLSAQYDTIYVNGKATVNRGKKIIDRTPASPISKDDFYFDISFGYPFMPLREAQAFGINLFTNTQQKSIKRNTNHICARAEYQLNEELSVGLELTYASSEITYLRSYAPSYSNSVTINYPDSTFNATANKIRFLAKTSYHFNISDKFDAYITGGFGFKKFTYSSRDLYLTTSNLTNEILPVAIRASIGGRFFLNKNVAIHVEGGIGGPLMQMGLTYKMHSIK